MRIRPLAVVVAILFAAPRVEAAETCDVLVYGGTPGGLSAALAASREGASVVVIEPTRWIGGMVTGGLASTDVGNEKVIGGIAREFFTRAAEAKAGTPMWFAEPKVNMATFKAMLQETKIKVVTDQRLKSISRDGDRIESLMTSDGIRYEAKVFIDATYEGDLLARAGVSYAIGRESRDTYNEPLAGFLPAPLRPRTVEQMAQDSPSIGGPKDAMNYVHGTPAKIEALDVAGLPLPGISNQWFEVGAGDSRTQAYNFRVIVTRQPENRLPFPKPAHYDPMRYELLARTIAAFPGIRFSKLVYLGPIANGKYDANAIGLVVGTDHVGANYNYPDGDEKVRAKIWQDHIDYVQGFLWFLANDSRSPKELQAQAKEWGLAKDEFTDNDNWPYALYVREARRMIGEYVTRQDDCTQHLTKPDSIGMGSFIMDSHAVERLVDHDGSVIDEGNFDVPVRPYHIPYRSLVPQKKQCENLLVPVCISASHVAYGSIRMEPQFMILGQACGDAAVQAIHEKKAVQDIDVAALQTKLREQKQVLDLPLPPGSAAAKDLPGIVMDDADAQYVGEWQASSSSGGVDGMYRHDMNQGKGEKSARFELHVPKDGKYEVRFAYTTAPNRATNVPVSVKHANGENSITVNEKLTPAINQAFVSLGTFRFTADKPAVVTVTTMGTDGYVVVDAVQLLPAE
ncbi:putative secreted protein-putative xanthan lyase related [Chthoniobacter flavus Ellin428]|uniref:Putative secreted protein-putative xanthan lyase related n=1 Tax=Chthoniobacter flavus Ellin428 TaxID=497964 RepID=B4DB75_9BACT|nr:FAD-dependent oxidoreductase [Chthoniobacter flavus]EDY16353.1 putative secreted protein-putative xanthan lyase related [Chthoniobacter flavus Ellin428]TCO90233.1 FAD dependent oxidoreductase [Chthoniobacter flavus]